MKSPTPVDASAPMSSGQPDNSVYQTSTWVSTKPPTHQGPESTETLSGKSGCREGRDEGSGLGKGQPEDRGAWCWGGSTGHGGAILGVQGDGEQ